VIIVKLMLAALYIVIAVILCHAVYGTISHTEARTWTCFACTWTCFILLH